jgi:hypothetical protein
VCSEPNLRARTGKPTDEAGAQKAVRLAPS